MTHLTPPQSLEDLARLAREGSSEAFEALARRVRPRVMGLLRRRFGSLEDVEDLCQETLLRAYRGLDKYDPSRPFAPWVLTIAANVGASAARRAAARLDEVPLTAVASAESPRQRPERTAVEADRRELVWRTARQVLSDREYQVLWLHYAAGSDARSTAQSLGLTRTHVKVLLHRARKKLLKQSSLRNEV